MVKFIDDNGVEFFECHPAEARTAIEIIQDVRDKNPVLPPEVKRVLKLVPKLLSGRRTVIQGKGSTINRIADSFAEIEKHDERVVLVLCSAKAYAEVRKWDRDTIDIETKATYLRSGIMAYVWGAMIILDRKAPDNVFIMADENGKYAVETEVCLERPSVLEVLFKMQKLISEAIKCVC